MNQGIPSEQSQTRVVTVPADPRKLADTAREAHPYDEMTPARLADSELGLIRFAYGDGPPSNEEGKAWPPRVAAAWYLANHVHALVALAEQLQQELADAQAAVANPAGGSIQATQALLAVERAARESAERERESWQATAETLQETETMAVLFADEQERRVSAEAASRAAQARADEAERRSSLVTQALYDWLVEHEGYSPIDAVQICDRILTPPALAASPQAGDCEHEWVSARNEAVESGEICVKCFEMRSEPPQADEHQIQDDLVVLGTCAHGVDLDREFCPQGCRV